MGIVGSLVQTILNFLKPDRPWVEIEADLDKSAKDHPDKPTDWRNSIVDLMKITGQDSSLAARKQLAQELWYTGPLDGSAKMNIWLHAELMRRIKAS